MIDFSALGIIINPNGPAEQRVRCRCEGRQKDTLGVNIATGVFSCFRCRWKGRASSDVGAHRAVVQRLDDPARAEKKRERLRATWAETVPLDHSKAHAVRTYLQARALGDVLRSPPTVVRAHPALEYWDHTQSLGRFPAMVALFHSAAGEPITLHTTFLRMDGCAKAAVPAPRKILSVPVRGATKGGAIRLYRPQDGDLGICEGIESALSLSVLHAIPVWASYCADNLERVRLPQGLRRLLIGVDLDESGKGEAAAKALAARVLRWKSRIEVLYVTPDIEAPADLNDELRRRRFK